MVQLTPWRARLSGPALSVLFGFLATLAVVRPAGWGAPRSTPDAPVLQESKGELGRRVRARLVYSLGKYLERHRETAAADRAFLQAARLAREAGDELLHAGILGYRGYMLGIHHGDFVGAETQFLRARAILDEQRASPTAYANLHSNVAAVRHRQGDCEAARLGFQLAWDIRRLALGPKSRETLTAMRSVGITQVCLGRTARGKKLVRQALRIARQELGADDPLTRSFERTARRFGG